MIVGQFYLIIHRATRKLLFQKSQEKFLFLIMK